MNEPSDLPSDEELSAAIDGEAGDDSVALGNLDPAAQARSDALSEAAALVASSPVEPLPADTVDALIGAALDEPIAPPVRAGGRGAPAPWLVAAAVLSLVAIGLALIWSGRSTSDEATAKFNNVGASIDETAGSGGADASTAGEASAESAADSAENQATTAAPALDQDGSGLIDLGAFASADELRVALADSFLADESLTSTSRTSRRSLPSQPAVDRCAEQLRVALTIDADPQQAGFASVDGRDVLVYEFPIESFDDGDATTLVAAVGVDACDEVVLFER